MIVLTDGVNQFGIGDSALEAIKDAVANGREEATPAWLESKLNSGAIYFMDLKQASAQVGWKGWQ